MVHYTPPASANATTTFNMSNGPTPQSAVSTGWSDARNDLLEALGHLGQLIDALAGLFGPGVAAPLRAALDEVRSHELYVVDGVIDNEARLRDQVGHLTQQLNQTIEARDTVRGREAKKDRVATSAVIDEIQRAYRAKRALRPWAVDMLHGLGDGWSWMFLATRERDWLEACAAAVEMKAES